MWYKKSMGIPDTKRTTKTVQLTVDAELLEQVDKAATRLGQSRAAFAREALRVALASFRERELEERHRRGYERFPVEPGEFDVWEPEQVWGDDWEN